MEKNKVNWMYYTKNKSIVKSTDEKSRREIVERKKHLKDVIDVFNKKIKGISSEKHYHKSNEVLKIINKIDGYEVEKSKHYDDLIKILGYEEDEYYKDYIKLFCVDAFNEKNRTILEIEAGRAYDNNQILKDLFEACISTQVDYLVIAVRNTYRGRNDFEYVNRYFNVLHHSEFWKRIPLEGILIIGY